MHTKNLLIKALTRISYGDMMNDYLSGMNKRRKLFLKSMQNVDTFIGEFENLSNDLLLDESFMEKFLIEKVGLNNEILTEQPSELSQYFGKGLYLWQNPKQFSKYLVWLMKNATNCSSYLEIGCRWGGTFIVVCEVLRRANPNFNLAIAVDLIEPTPFINRYCEIARKKYFEVVYFQGSSTSKKFADLITEKKPDIAFIDGDHNCLGALKDHMLVRNYSKIIVHHDISSDSCPATTYLWKSLKELEINRTNVEFIDQYESVKGKFLGIGILSSIH